MKRKDVITLVQNIRRNFPSECQIETGDIKDGETYTVTIRIPVDKVLQPIDYSRKAEKMKWDKLTIEGFRCILGSIGEDVAEDEISDEELSCKILTRDFGLDELDFSSLIMTMEKLFHVSVSDNIWYEWHAYQSSLTVNKFVDDWNNIVL
ncbi:MAG: hypothetical protein IJ660_08130 [Alphaproteobacteria bacterium]|nr:hypothetical protein [Alphaproteobacteria bacterium]